MLLSDGRSKSKIAKRLERGQWIIKNKFLKVASIWTMRIQNILKGDPKKEIKMTINNNNNKKIDWQKQIEEVANVKWKGAWCQK